MSGGPYTVIMTASADDAASKAAALAVRVQVTRELRRELLKASVSVSAHGLAARDSFCR
jgi:hypothetical protein